MRFSSYLTGTFTAIGLIAVSAQGGAVSWDGGASTSSWHDANNWNPNGVPGAADQVTIGVAGAPGTSYAVNVTSSVIMDSLTLNASSSVNITGGGAEAVFQVDGGTASVLNPLTLIELEDINATLLFSTASQSITGGGTIQLDDVGALLEIGSGLTLTSDVVVKGYGSLAADSGTATFVNNEVVSANSSGNTLELFSTLILDDADDSSAIWKAVDNGKLQFMRDATLSGDVEQASGGDLDFQANVGFTHTGSVYTRLPGTLIVASLKTFTYYDFDPGLGSCSDPAMGAPCDPSTDPPSVVCGGNGGFSSTCN